MEPADAWRRLKGLERFDDAAFAAARALAAWRERRAMARDLPRGWVLPDAAIHQLAQSRPRTREQLSRADAVPPGTAARAADELLAAIAAATEDAPPRDAVVLGRPGADELRLEKALQKRARRDRGRTRHPAGESWRRGATSTALSRGERELPVLSGWRREVVGERLLAVR